MLLDFFFILFLFVYYNVSYTRSFKLIKNIQNLLKKSYVIIEEEFNSDSTPSSQQDDSETSVSTPPSNPRAKLTTSFKPSPDRYFSFLSIGWVITLYWLFLSSDEEENGDEDEEMDDDDEQVDEDEDEDDYEEKYLFIH